MANLAEIEIRDTLLRGLRRKNLEGMQKIILLSIKNTTISSFPDDVFNALINFQDLTIRKNLLISWASKLFHPLNFRRKIQKKFSSRKKIIQQKHQT